MSGDWYSIVEGSDIEQGDIIARCPIFYPIADESGSELADYNCTLEFQEYDVIVLSQTCDLVAGRKKLDHVLLCALFEKSWIDSSSEHLLNQKGMMKKASNNELPAYHLINQHVSQFLSLEVSAVSFRQIYTLPIELLRRVAAERGKRLRLNSPYREELALRFGQFFQRVARPDSIKI